ncbi:hypothetical protein ACHQM5_016051 [Ranunculus cassubicifolius]
MALHHHHCQQQESSDPHYLLIDSLFCQEEQWIEEEELGLNDDESIYNNIIIHKNGRTPLPSKQDLFWEDEELVSLFKKEKDTHLVISAVFLDDSNSSLCIARQGAIEWMLRVNAHYSFSPLCAVLSVNYLDRFLSSFQFQKDKPWMIQLAAVACLSLAAKVEETQVPLLLDLQVEDTKYVFEAKTIQRMELLVLSTLQWRMNPVTPLSFLDHIIRRLGLKNHLHWEFFRRCEGLLLSAILDSRFTQYLPSMLATATMLLAIDQIEPRNADEYQEQLISILKITKDEVENCYQFIRETTLSFNVYNNNKRKFQSIPSSPNGVVDVTFSCENSNDSWAMNSSISSSPEPLFKKSRAQDQQMRLPTFNRAFVDVPQLNH